MCREGNGTTYWRDGSIYSGEYRAVSIPANISNLIKEQSKKFCIWFFILLKEQDQWFLGTDFLFCLTCWKAQFRISKYWFLTDPDWDLQIYKSELQVQDPECQLITDQAESGAWSYIYVAFKKELLTSKLLFFTFYNQNLTFFLKYLPVFDNFGLHFCKILVLIQFNIPLKKMHTFVCSGLGGRIWKHSLPERQHLGCNLWTGQNTGPRSFQVHVSLYFKIEADVWAL